jgi:hypothetical protein
MLRACELLGLETSAVAGAGLARAAS